MDSPSYDEVERPPLRQIDKYVRAELFGLSARYTVSVMAMLGFIISFGMRCNMGMAKLEKERESGVSDHWSALMFRPISEYSWSRFTYTRFAANFCPHAFYFLIGLRVNRPWKMNAHMKEISVKSDKNDFNHVANNTTTKTQLRIEGKTKRKRRENLYHSCFVWFFISIKSMRWKICMTKRRESVAQVINTHNKILSPAPMLAVFDYIIVMVAVARVPTSGSLSQSHTIENFRPTGKAFTSCLDGGGYSFFFFVFS